MKLRNKKTGKIKDFVLFDGKNELQGGATLKYLVEEWEDYKEPKDYYIINLWGEVSVEGGKYQRPGLSELGLTFETKEEAEKAVEKLKAWKRLKDNGFEFGCYMRRSDWAGLSEVKALENLIDITAYLPKNKFEKMKEDLEIIFGGEE